MLFLYLPIVFWPHYPWYFKPSTHGILTPFPYFDYCPWCLWPTYPWYFVPPAYLLIINEEGQNTGGGSISIQGGWFSIRVLNIPWMKIDPGIQIPWESKYHMSARTLAKSIQFLFISISSFPKSNVSICLWVSLWFLERQSLPSWCNGHSII